MSDKNQHGGPRPVVRDDDQRRKNTGGTREGSGRPSIATGETVVRKNTILTESQAEKVIKIGGGNFSMGVRLLLENWENNQIS